MAKGVYIIKGARVYGGVYWEKMFMESGNDMYRNLSQVGGINYGACWWEILGPREHALLSIPFLML